MVKGKGSVTVRIPKYISEHIEKNNKLLEQADKHSRVVIEWYEKQLNTMGAESSPIPDDDFSDIQNNWLDNGLIDESAIKLNLELLENKEA